MNLSMLQFIIGLVSILITNAGLVAVFIYKVSRWISTIETGIEKVESKVDSVDKNLTLSLNLKLENIQLQINQLRKEVDELKST